MSLENIETLRRLYRLMNTRFAELKAGDLDEFLEYFDPEVVIEAVDAPDPATYEGHDGVRRWFADALGVWDSVHVEPEEFLQSEDWTVVQLRTTVRGESSGVEIEILLTAVHRFRNGLIFRDRIYLDHAQALEAAGLHRQAT
ncbi:MAG TPA: nuclear transport factor 2 family protein [Thermoleophilaceae bacterium]|jgi:ketosteroid isomerase-like protein